MNCSVCQQPMVKMTEWAQACRSCGFECSTLSPGAGRGVEGLEILRKANFKIILSELSQMRDLTSLKCLEVGCAEGWFIEALKKQGVEVSAIEPSSHAIEMQGKGFDVIHGFFPDALPAQNTYDMIVFNDVFEHLPDPVAGIKACERHLKKGGLLVLNLPNRNGFLYRMSKWMKGLGVAKPFERMWQKEFPSPHISYFSDSNIEMFVHRHTGLQKKKHFYLASVVKNGLGPRIQASYGGIAGKIIYVSLLAFLPAIKFLPQDIMVFVFAKRGGKE